MTEARLKPVPGYGDALIDFNRIPVLAVADQVKRDIMLPVLDRRSDLGSVRSQARFLRSSGGSLLKNRQPVVLANLESEAGNHTVGDARYGWKPLQRGWWCGVDFYQRDDVSVSLAIYNGPDDEIYTITFGDPVLWLPRIQGRLYLRALGVAGKKAFFRLDQFG